MEANASGNASGNRAVRTRVERLRVVKGRVGTE